MSPGRAFSLSKSRALAKGSSGVAAQGALAGPKGAKPKGAANARGEMQCLGPMGLGVMALI